MIRIMSRFRGQMVTLQDFTKCREYYSWEGTLAFQLFDSGTFFPEAKNLPLLPPEVRKFVMEYEKGDPVKFQTSDGEISVPLWMVNAASVFSNRTSGYADGPLPVSTETVEKFISIYSRYAEGESLSEEEQDIVHMFGVGIMNCPSKRELYMDYLPSIADFTGWASLLFSFLRR